MVDQTLSTFSKEGKLRRVLPGHSIGLRQTHPKFLRLEGQAGDVVRAFGYLGREGVTNEHLLQISRILDDGAKRALVEYQPCLPAWMGSKIKILAELP